MDGPRDAPLGSFFPLQEPRSFISACDIRQHSLRAFSFVAPLLHDIEKCIGRLPILGLDHPEIGIEFDLPGDFRFGLGRIDPGIRMQPCEQRRPIAVARFALRRRARSRAAAPSRRSTFTKIAPASAAPRRRRTATRALERAAPQIGGNPEIRAKPQCVPFLALSGGSAPKNRLCPNTAASCICRCGREFIRMDGLTARPGAAPLLSRTRE